MALRRTASGRSLDIVVQPSTRKKGKWDLFVGGFHRVTKSTRRGAEGYASRILRANRGTMPRKRKRNLTLPGFLVATKKNGKRVRANTSVKMTLRDLRRLISGAKKGKQVKVKARVR